MHFYSFSGESLLCKTDFSSRFMVQTQPHCLHMCSQPFWALQEGSQGRVWVSLKVEKEVGSAQCCPTSVGPSLLITAFLPQQSEHLRQNTPIGLCLVLHTHVWHLSKLQASYGCHKFICTMKLSPEQACGSPTKSCNQGSSSSLEVITVDFGLKMGTYFQVMTCGHTSQSTQYRLKQQGPGATLGSRELL